MSRLVLDPFDDLSLFEVILDRVALVDFGVRESDGPGVTSDDVGDLVGTNSFLCDLQQFEFGLSILYLDKSESSLDVIKDSVVLIGLGDRYSVHDSDGKLDRSSDFIINSDSALFVLHDDVGFTGVEAELKVVPG